MNLTCTNCGVVFRVTADQLGTRGKCPHCKATIILPRAARQPSPDGKIEPPALWFERWLSITGTAFLHLTILAILALIPGTAPEIPDFGKGQPVRIGTASELAARRGSDQPVVPERVPLESAPRSSLLFRERDVLQPAASSASGSPDAAMSGDGNSGQFGADAFAVFRGVSEEGEDFDLLLERLQNDGLELVITFDSTGSMEGEIDAVKNRIERMGQALFHLVPKTRISICSYRDEGEQYVVQGLPLTDELGDVVRFLQTISAAGGGDEPEAVLAGLKWSMEENRFRDQARKVILLFGDSPPHSREREECLRLASEFRRQQGGIVSTVTCRQEHRLPAFIEIARLGGGEAFLTRNEHEIMAQLMILIFGSEHEEKVIEAFNLMIR